MKKLAITIGLLAGATVGYSQGVINWSDYAPASGSLPQFSIEVFGPGTGGPGNTINDFPAANNTYSGAPVNGAGYTVGLYVDTTAANVQNDILTGTPVATDTFQSGLAGRWDTSAGLNATTGFASGTGVFIGIAAWSGNSASFATASLVPNADVGDVISTSTAPLGGGGTPPATAGTLAGIGLTSFAINPVPEPSTIALGVIGASTFLMRLRRKQ
jgi:hypothetical protein